MKRGVASLLLAGLALLAAAEKGPNIVLIVADDMGYAEMGCQGGDIPTPNIDALAQSGVRFTSGYVSCPVCAPTRAGLLTGLYQQSFGLEFNPGPQGSASETYGLPKDKLTLAERLKKEGYDTGMVGKWHLGYQPGFRPTERGFDSFFGFLGGANAYQSNDKGAKSTIYRGTELVGEKDYLTDAFGREATTFIKKHRDKPFFLYMPFNAVHAPLQAPDKYKSQFSDIKDPKRQTFAAMLTALDTQVGAIVKTLKDNKLDKNTLVVFISDNGGPTSQTTSGNKPLHGFKGQVYEGGVRIPYMMSWPGHIEGGRVIDKPVISLDVVPTALDAAGAKTEDQLHGVSLMPLLRGESVTPHESLFWRMGQQHAARVGDWKLVSRNGVTELFNLTDDIGEAKDLSKSNPEKLKELESAYDAWSKTMADPKWGQKAAKANNTTGVKQITAKQLKDKFDELDKNKDGKIGQREYPRPVIFGRVDTNKDGFISRDEAEAASKAGRRGS